MSREMCSNCKGTGLDPHTDDGDSACPDCTSLTAVAGPLTPTLYLFIRDLGGEGGWWHTAGQHTFERIAVELLTAGLNEDRVIDILGQAHNAVAEEYGD